MRQIRTSGLMSGDGKRGGATSAQQPRPSSTLPGLFSQFDGTAKAVPWSFYILRHDFAGLRLSLILPPKGHALYQGMALAMPLTRAITGL
jgi:hypothetical protein